MLRSVGTRLLEATSEAEADIFKVKAVVDPMLADSNSDRMDRILMRIEEEPREVW